MALFFLSTHEPSEAKGKQVADLLHVHVPSLQIEKKISVLYNNTAPTAITYVPDSDIAYLSYGGFSKEHMNSDKLNTILTVRKINVVSGDVLWQHEEKVTARIRK